MRTLVLHAGDHTACPYGIDLFPGPGFPVTGVRPLRGRLPRKLRDVVEHRTHTMVDVPLRAVPGVRNAELVLGVLRTRHGTRRAAQAAGRAAVRRHTPGDDLVLARGMDPTSGSRSQTHARPPVLGGGSDPHAEPEPDRHPRGCRVPGRSGGRFPVRLRTGTVHRRRDAAGRRRLRHPAEREALAEAGRAVVTERFTYDRMWRALRDELHDHGIRSGRGAN